MGSWDWQVFLQDPGGKIPTYWQWMLSAWGWTLSVSVCGLVLALIVGSVIGTIRTLLGKKPIFGICLGHQMLALAAGALLASCNIVTPVAYAIEGPGQIEAELKRHGFTPERNFTVLHAPPSQAPFWLRSSNLWERMGRRLPWLSGGVLMVEASKQVYAPTRGGLLQRATKPVRLWEPAAQPVASPKH